jgi:hypothetical protein
MLVVPALVKQVIDDAGQFFVFLYAVFARSLAGRFSGSGGGANLRRSYLKHVSKHVKQVA